MFFFVGKHAYTSKNLHYTYTWKVAHFGILFQRLGHAWDLLNPWLQLGEIKTLLFYLYLNEWFDILIEGCNKESEHIIHYWNVCYIP